MSQSLAAFAIEDNAIRVGAAVRQAELLAWPELAARQPLLAQALPWVGHAQTRARGTVCGSVALADPSAELPLCLLALGGEVVLSSKSGAAARCGRRLLHRPDVDRARRRRTDRGRVVSVRACRRRLRVPRIRAPSRRFRHRGLRGGRDGEERAGSRSAALRIGRSCATSTTSARMRCDAFASELDARDDLHATADYRRALVRKLGRVHDRGGAPMPRLSADARHTIRLEVNGRAVEGEAEPRMLLTDFLRHKLGAHRHACRLRARRVRRLHGADRRRAGARLPHARGAGRRRVDPHGRRPRAGARPPLGAAGGVPPPSRAAMRLLHARHPDVARLVSARHARPDEAELREFLSGHICRCTGYVPIVAAALDAAKRLRDA